MSYSEPDEIIYNPAHLDQYMQSRTVVPSLRDQFGLSKREMLVCEHLVKGKAVCDISKALNIQEITTRDFIKKIRSKLKIPLGNHSTLKLLRQITEPVAPESRPVLIADHFRTETLYGRALRAIPAILRGVTTKGLKEKFNVSPEDLKEIYKVLGVNSRTQIFPVFFVAPDEGEFGPRG